MRKRIFCKKVCIIGAESTGTTTMARALAEYYKTVWVPEFGRLYSEGKLSLNSGWELKEFIFIANQQNKLEDQFAGIANKILICDTDSFATTLWHERYRGFISKSVDRLSEGRACDLYFLTDVDIPFVQDGTRDGEHIRHSMHQRFIDELTRRHKKFIILSGSHAERLNKAIKECDKLLKQ